MSDELRNQIRNNLSLKDTNELLEIWKINDRVEWSDTAFEVLREVLRERVKETPPQDEPILEHKEEPMQDDGLEEWETKLLDDENQPELYNTLEVLKLRDNINKVAIGVIIVYVLLGLLNFQFVSAFLQGTPISFSETLRSLPNAMFTILTIGLQIVITYFPLKALAHILRILMEMEFRSRKGTRPNPLVE